MGRPPGAESGRLLTVEGTEPFLSLLASLTSALIAASLLLVDVDDAAMLALLWAAAAAAVRTSVADLMEEPSILPKQSS